VVEMVIYIVLKNGHPFYFVFAIILLIVIRF